MYQFINILQFRNTPLFIFGCANLLAAFIFLLLTRFTTVIIRGANSWYKPFKFALSIAIFSFTMGWYTFILNEPVAVNIYNRVVIALLGFEVVYIAIQAARGQLSHYNSSSAVYTFLTVLMALAAAIVTLWTGYIGILFFNVDLKGLPDYYVLSIRIGILLFVVFAFQGASMGARGTHTVGGPEGDLALPVLNWSTRYGDLRIAHFIGMHALQVLPLLSWYVFRNTFFTAMAGVLYTGLAIFTLVCALQSKSLFAGSGRTNYSNVRD